MIEAKKEQLSAFMDDEIDGQHKSLVSQLLKDAEMLGTWSRYHLISDCLKQWLPERVDTSLAENISKSLRKEPAIIAPSRPTHTFVKPVAGFAIAASVAALAILGIQQQQPGGSHELPQDMLAQPTPSGAGSSYAPVRQVSSVSTGIITECDTQSAGNSQPDTDSGQRGRAGDRDSEENCQ